MRAVQNRHEHSCWIILILFTASLVSGCPTPLQTAVKKVAGPSGYQAREPASSVDVLGRNVVDGKIVPNACYIGERFDAGSGFTEVHISYDNTSEADLRTDFGNSASLGAGYNRVSHTAIDLTEISEQTLRAVRFDPGSVCTPAKGSAWKDEVVISSLKAATIKVVDTADGGVGLDLKVSALDGGVVLKSSFGSADTYVGADLNFAYQTMKFSGQQNQSPPCARVQTEDSCPERGLPTGCVFKLLSSAADGSWKGQFACSALAAREAAGRIGVPQPLFYSDLPEGVSYSVLVDRDGPLFTIQLTRWAAVPER